MIHISSYGSNSKNGAHCMAVKIGNLSVYYSYRSVVAFRYPDFGLVVSENVFGKVTGKHIAVIKAMGKWIEKARDVFLDLLRQAEHRNMIQMARRFLTDRMAGKGMPEEKQEEWFYEHEQPQPGAVEEGDPG